MALQGAPKPGARRMLCHPDPDAPARPPLTLLCALHYLFRQLGNGAKGSLRQVQQHGRACWARHTYRLHVRMGNFPFRQICVQRPGDPSMSGIV